MAGEHIANKVLVVDDDRGICTFLERFLGGEGFAVQTVHEGHKMRLALADDAFNLILLDLGFPQGEDGMTLARRLRAQYDYPLIILSGKNSTIDKVVCLELGADDYVTKPFEPRELLARMRSVMRRYSKRVEPAPDPDRPETALSFAGWKLDLEHHALLSAAGERTRLTGREFEVLRTLVQRRGRILTREQILDIVANRAWSPYDRSVDVLIGKIRRKLHDDASDGQFIKTVRGVGYMFAPPDRV
ncbi:winged helix-turn-helix domain-containing protein [Roseovarius sp. M141]|uniref:winged helix-turn-helix domain-containing protein n=1 Tax=Roseovarius sp. M141 TaxID=2583806 RepID=UPI0020CE5768|nr:response regulator transcription factor [Roseovarius sp. M141]MCQ0091863.1 response regulator transcription factor [Roseovarius sp. M141]